ncbi:hypothetical protein AB205_0217980, partial [Aquarana catesbeiana]
FLRFVVSLTQEASRRFTLPSGTADGSTKQENFVLGSSSTDQVKGVLTLQGDTLCQAEVNLKVLRTNQLLHFAFREDKQWKMQQLMDAVMLQLTRARNRLTTPATMTLPEVATIGL